jgi:hypothetical protein
MVLAGGGRAASETAVPPCRFEKVDQLKQEMRRKKELERRLRLGDVSRGDEDAAEQDNVRRLLAAVHASWQPAAAASTGSSGLAFQHMLISMEAILLEC